ncbi:MAG: flagellar motor switch protein FliG [Planctomycetales bacterium]|nr:flagellar motor switch protein FliG [Planctomycetales bacterium]
MANLQKAAILLASLPRDEAIALLGRLDDDQAKAVTIEMANLGRIAADVQKLVFSEFERADPNAFSGEHGGREKALDLLTTAKAESKKVIDDVRQSIDAMPFGFLRRVDPQNLLTFVMDEHPQTIALILSHLPPAYGAEIISGLPAERQLAVIRRIANMGQTNPAVIEEVESGLEKRMDSIMSQSYERAGGVPSVAEILNVTDRATERTLLESLGQDDPDLVDEIRRLMFVFDDVAQLTDKDIQTVLKNVESAQWALALKGADETIKQKILGNMSKRAADMLVEEMDYLGPVRLSDVESTQQQIVDIVRRLEDAGEITVRAGDEEEEFIT